MSSSGRPRLFRPAGIESDEVVVGRERRMLEPEPLPAPKPRAVVADVEGGGEAPVRAPRVFRAARSEDEVYVVGQGPRSEIPTAAPIATAQDVIAAAYRRASAIVAEAEAQAAEITGSATRESQQARTEGYSDGYEAGRAEVYAEFERHLELIRAAAGEGKALRDSVASHHLAVVARAAALATRRIVGEFYQHDPERTVALCRDALRAASGQDVLSIRVNPAVAGAVQAQLGDAGEYVRPDESIEIGGCIVDLRNGTLDASLEARLSLMEVALRSAGGAAA